MKSITKKFFRETAKVIVVFGVIAQLSFPAGLIYASADAQETETPQEQQIEQPQPQEAPLASDTGTATIEDPETVAQEQQEPAVFDATEATEANEESPAVAVSEPAILTDTPSGDPAAVNVNTGDNSTNTTETNTNNNTNITNNNNAVTNNNAMLLADTGHNHANYNTGSGIISTQRARGQGEMVNLINKNVVNVDPNNPIVATAGNQNTGDGSNNQALTNINNQLTVRNINSSNTANVVDANVYSGQNSASHNTSHGIVLTGEANLGLNFISFANTNIVNNQRVYANWQNVYDNFSGNIDLSAEAASAPCALSGVLATAFNRNTGAGSNNQAIVNVNDQTQITNQNSGILRNQITANVVSGQNQSSYNSGTGSVTSGNVNSSVNVLNFLNTNITASNMWLKNLNVFGNWNGNIVLPQMSRPNLALGAYHADVAAGNSGTGNGSVNQGSVNVNNSIDLNNQNQAVIKNNVALKTNTGDNQASFNTSSGVIKFGGSDAQTNELNVANLNVTGDSWWMVVVNKFGGWNGTALGAPEDAIVTGSSSTTVITPQNSGVVVANSPTGPESNNMAGANINHSTSIENSNDALIENNIAVNNITGENETRYNTGHGYIESGDIKSSVNLVNIANANITAGNWMVVVVNVFGEWDGNLVFRTTGVDNAVVLPNTGDTNTSVNSNTGDNSSNNSSSTNNNSTNVTNNNNSNTNNNTSGSSVTGQNDANYNTGSGIVSTGGADTGVGTGNQTNNTNTTVGQGGNNNTGSQNNGTGDNSSNNSSSTNNSATNVTNNNTSNTNNNASGNNNTGQNSNSYNTGDGLIDTGWASTYLGIYNQTNNTHETIGDLKQNVDVIDPGTNGNGNGGGGGGGGGTPVIVPANSVSSVPVIYSLSKGKKKKGDLNGDGKVDDLDFSILMGSWGLPKKDKRADANEDGKIDALDFSFVMSGWDNLLALSPKKVKA